jgi:hypothetical protein
LIDYSPQTDTNTTYARELNEREIRPKIKMTSPSEQVVEQAKSEVVRKKRTKSVNHNSNISVRNKRLEKTNVPRKRR